MKTPTLELVEVTQADTPAADDINDSFWALDAIVQLTVLDKDLNEPPDDAVQGARYIVASGPTGEWAGHARHIAYLTPDGWLFRTPRPGWIAYVLDELTQYVFTEDSEWDSLLGSGGSFPDFSGGNAPSTSFQVNFLLGVAHELTLLGDVTLSFINAIAGKVCRTVLIVHQDTTGGRVLTWPNGAFWPGGEPPAISTLARSVHVYEASTYDGGITIYVRLVAGSVYSGDSVPATYPTTEDPYWPYVEYLMHMNGADNGTVFTDERGHVASRVGDPVTSTAQKKFGTASASFHYTPITMPPESLFETGHNINYLTFPEGPENDFTSGDFSIEMWVRLKSSGIIFNGWVLAMKGGASESQWLMFHALGNALMVTGFGDSVTTWNVPFTSWLDDTEFKHVFLERRNGVFYLGLDGFMWTDGVVRDLPAGYYSDGPFTIGGGQMGAAGGGNQPYRFADLYIDDFRVTMGRARYAPEAPPVVLDEIHYFATYTPPNTAFDNPASYDPEVKTPRRTVGATWTTGSDETVSSPTNDVFVRVPNRSLIRRATILTEGGVGDCEVDVRLADLGDFPPGAPDSIVAASPVLGISGDVIYDDETLAGWTTEIPVNSVLGFHLVDSAVFTTVTILLELEDIQ